LRSQILYLSRMDDVSVQYFPWSVYDVLSFVATSWRLFSNSNGIVWMASIVGACFLTATALYGWRPSQRDYTQDVSY
jgi:hypothetical protein